MKKLNFIQYYIVYIPPTRETSLIITQFSAETQEASLIETQEAVQRWCLPQRQHKNPHQQRLNPLQHLKPWRQWWSGVPHSAGTRIPTITNDGWASTRPRACSWWHCSRCSGGWYYWERGSWRDNSLAPHQEKLSCSSSS